MVTEDELLLLWFVSGMTLCSFLVAVRPPWPHTCDAQLTWLRLGCRLEGDGAVQGQRQPIQGPLKPTLQLLGSWCRVVHAERCAHLTAGLQANKRKQHACKAAAAAAQRTMQSAVCVGSSGLREWMHRE